MMMMSQAATRKSINVAIVEDDSVTRKVLSAAIQSEPALRLVGAFDRIRPALKCLESTPVDLLLTDLALPDGSGIDLIRACVGYWPQCGIMVITMSSNEGSVLARMRDALPPSCPTAAADDERVMLTRREAAILKLIARGDSYSEIARELGVSVCTIQTHAKNLYAKLSVHSRGEAVFQAQRRGLLQMESLTARAS